jgi:tetratricopeptide (TPR) repeat protein
MKSGKTTRQQRVVPLRAPASAAPRRRWAFRLAAATLIPALVLVAVELALRLAGLGYPTGFFLETTRNGQRVLIENSRFGWRFFPPHLARTPQPLVLAARKPPQTCRIFVFGESAAMGDPDPDFGLARVLPVLLQDQFPGTTFEVANVAMAAINSHVVREIARDCAAREGDFWVVYMGNNEVIGPFGAGTIFGREAPNRAVIRLTLALGQTRLGQLVQALSSRLGREKTMPHTWGGLEMFASHQVRAAAPRLKRVRDYYRENLAEIIRLGRAAGATVIVSTVASNLKDCAPFGSQHRAGLSPADLERWEKAFNAGVAAESAGQFAEAVSQFHAAAEIDDSFAALQFRLGRSLMASGKSADAKTAFERARDEDTLRFRADTQNNAIVRAVARNRAAEGVYLVDAEAELARRSPEGVCGLNFFWEHVHLNFAGTHALAESIARQIAGVLPEGVKRSRTGRPWLSAEECARRLTYSRWNERKILNEIFLRQQKPPWTLQLDHAERDALWRKKLTEQESATQPPALSRTIAAVREIVRASPSDWVLHKNLGQLLEAAGDLPGAFEEWREVAGLLPQSANAWYHLGNVLDMQGRSAEAQAHFERALALSPGMVEAMNGLGLALAAQGKLDQAFRQYARAIRTNPDSIHAYVNWGLGLAGQQRFAEAVAQYELALRVNPEDALTHNNIAVALAALGRNEEAIRHYSRSVELKPDFLVARINLARELVARGQAEAAIVQLEAALRLNPSSPAVHLQMGLAHERLGHRYEAAQHFQRVLELDPKNPEAESAWTRLQGPAQ